VRWYTCAEEMLCTVARPARASPSQEMVWTVPVRAARMDSTMPIAIVASLTPL
jgi:hypothetical protein